MIKSLNIIKPKKRKKKRRKNSSTILTSKRRFPANINQQQTCTYVRDLELYLMPVATLSPDKSLMLLRVIRTGRQLSITLKELVTVRKVGWVLVIEFPSRKPYGLALGMNRRSFFEKI